MPTQLLTSKETILAHKRLLLYFDGSCEPKNPGGVACAAWLIVGDDPDKPPLTLAQSYEVVADGGRLATNNFAEYCGLGLSLKFLCGLGWRGTLTVKGDSQLVVKQVTGEWGCNKDGKSPHLQDCRARIYMRLIELGLATAVDENGIDIPVDINYTLFDIEWIPREQNELADKLSKQAYVERTGKQPPSRSHWKKRK